MRTTVEITDQQRARLLELAARRGEKGFSRLVREAIDIYLATRTDAARTARVRDALAALGSLDRKSADAIEERAHTLRSSWR